METKPPPMEPVAPYTGTIQYPLNALLLLARSIVKDLEQHHRTQLDAARAVNNEDEEADALDNLMDVDQTMFAIDRVAWRARVELDDPGHKWSDKEFQEFNDISVAEDGLLTLGRVPKSAWVLGQATERRKAHRGSPPESDPIWSKEDALIDFLMFLTNYNVAGLFSPSPPPSESMS
ncbi:hypothetical protein BD410DRAFT_108524 [Rickenella mellea]|uniref:Uncharacterized protein n=1 Tax=Rickenella mellea TaxID=50990 RepID=A0A4Y7PJ35_9AGAM|nr:hypothetical protein BD410DRAFT_108524 [Rickenella mellea]